MGVAPILSLLFVNCIVVAVILAIIAVRARQPRVKQPSCGQCRYAVEGLTVLTCPECGSDLRQVGILVPKYSGGVGPGIVALLWSLVLPVPAIIISVVVGEALPTVGSSGTDMSLTATSPGLQSVTLNLRSDRASSPRDYDHGSIILVTPQSPDATMHFKLSDGAISTADKSTDGDDAPLDEAQLSEWMADATGAPAEEFQDDAKDILAAISNSTGDASVVITNAFQNASVRTWSRVHPPYWYPPAAGVFWIAVWIGGIVLIFRRFRRRAAREDSDVPQSTSAALS